MRQRTYIARKLAVTMLELMIVILIISLLATVATGIYTGEAERARIAATKALINNLEIGITRYEVDTGQLPPSGSGDTMPPTEPFTAADTRRDGSGYLHEALVHSLSGNSSSPSPQGWNGPYVNFQAEQLRTPSEGTYTTNSPAQIDIIDAWGTALIYVRYSDYALTGTAFKGGTRLFSNSAPTGSNPNLPAPNPNWSLGETYYNAKSYQIISFGKDRTSFGFVNGSNYNGAAADDITNFGY